MSAAGVQIVRTTKELRSIVAAWRRDGHGVALVPTMGALHAGHLSLAQEALKRSSRVIMSIFVNPTQFSADEDLDSYPRTFEDDVDKFASAGGHLIWAPTPSEMYPEGFATRIVPEGAANGLETDVRPHFFGGVATVCCKLFTQTLPDFAMFGEKDYQQLSVMRQMVRDLDLPLEIVGCPTVREADGLAMSSRNAYLSNDERKAAVAIYTAITDVAQQIELGADIDGASQSARQALQAAGFGQIDYVAVRDAESLEAVTSVTDRPLRVLAAAWLGKTRLIDNVAAGPGSSR
ncbi:MAG: pantoate--beta-alanine ligase [Hyphomicrobiaceae bacterium]|jgi:pantoate--beta-alanine ligase